MQFTISLSLIPLIFVVADKMQEKKFCSDHELYCPLSCSSGVINFYWFTSSLLQMGSSQVLLWFILPSIHRQRTLLNKNV